MHFAHHFHLNILLVVYTVYQSRQPVATNREIKIQAICYVDPKVNLTLYP